MKKIIITMILMGLLLISSVFATRQIMTEEEIKDLTPANINSFLNVYQDRNNRYEWTRHGYVTNIKYTTIKFLRGSYYKVERNYRPILSREIIIKCLNTFNLETCKQQLIQRNTIWNVAGEEIEPMRYQLTQKIIKEKLRIEEIQNDILEDSTQNTFNTNEEITI